MTIRPLEPLSIFTTMPMLAPVLVTTSVVPALPEHGAVHHHEDVYRRSRRSRRVRAVANDARDGGDAGLLPAV